MMDAHTQPLPDLRKRYKALAKRMQTRDRTEKAALCGAAFLGLLCIAAALKEITK